MAGNRIHRPLPSVTPLVPQAHGEPPIERRPGGSRESKQNDRPLCSSSQSDCFTLALQ